MGRLSGKVALITGAGGGIGRATTLLFSSHGAQVVAVDIDKVNGLKTVQMSEEQGGDTLFVQANIALATDWENMIRRTTEHYGKLDILFNNAGIMHPDDSHATDTEENIWDMTMDINLKGVFFGCKYGIPALRNNGGGSVINTASFVAVMGAATPQIAYTASKGGVLAMTRELAIVHARENIRFNALCPGPLHTEMLMKFLDTERKKQRRLVHIPIGRFGLAEEMAEAALYLGSDESSYVPGTDFRVDGGITAAYETPE